MSATGTAEETDAGPRVRFNIPQQRADLAVTEFAEQADLTLIVPHDLVQDKEANELIGTYSLQEGIDLLLAGTGLSPAFSNRIVLSISADETSADQGESMDIKKKAGLLAVLASVFTGGANAQEGPDPGDEKNQPVALEEIIVTGTSIRGIVPESSPLQIYDVVDIRNTGAMTTEQFVSTLPQNSNTLSELGSGSSPREANINAVNSVDLRGLGVGSTLVLLNGRRMAPSSGGRAADISFIPIGAIERVEVLTDGASSVYGADAIGGVVNFVLRDQQESAETAVTLGGAKGGGDQIRIDQSFGFNWAQGNALVALSYMDRNDLDAADRSFSSAAAPFTLIPEDTRKNLLATISQTISGDVQISADILYSNRETNNVQSVAQFGGVDFSERQTDNEQTVVNLAIARSFADTLNIELLATYADASTDADSFNNGPIIGVGPIFETQDSSTLDITAKLDGELARFPSGPLMFALGAGYSEDEFKRFSDSTALVGINGELRSANLDRSTKYAFVEFNAPIVSSDQGVPGVRRLELSLSGRYTDFSDFGDATSPKIGILWSPVESLKIRGTFGESFKAPFLTQLDPTGANFGLFPIALLGTPDIWSTDNSTTMMFALGAGNPTLGAEESETQTLGFDFERAGLNISATYFNIEYTDRVSAPDPTAGTASLTNPQGFPELYNLNPTLEEVTAILATSSNSFNLLGIDGDDPAAVHAAITVLADNRIRNLAISEMDGLDLQFGYTTKSLGGELSFGVNASKIFDFEERIFASASPLARVDTVLYPADLKGRGYFGFRRDRWSARLNVNYVDGYENPFDPTNPRIDAWTTVDLIFSYEFSTDGTGAMNGVRMGLTVQNAFDEDPPFVGVGPQAGLSLLVPTGFDPANANPLGRFVSFQLAKRW